jgi:Ca-activated chloride channel family protein
MLTFFHPHWCQSRYRTGLLFCVCWFAATASSQTTMTDSVHIRPLTRQPAAAAGASTREEASSPLNTLRVDVDVVLVPVTITDAMNRPVTSMQKDDFLLYEGGVEQQIRYFSTDDEPISIGVLLDLSASMGNKIESAREALSEFFKTANPQDDYFVLTFADRPAVLSDATSSIGTIQAKLALAKPAGHTALLDAIYLGLSKTRSAQYRRRGLLIISDGGDNHSRYKSSEIKRLVQEADVEIYAIGLFDKVFRTPEEWAGKRLLTEITEATGGRTITPDNIADLPEVARRISLELRNRYVLGYRPSHAPAAPNWRNIKVQVKPSASAAPVQVHYRKGYLSPLDE